MGIITTYRATASPTKLHKNVVAHFKLDSNSNDTVRGVTSGGSVVSYVAGKVGNAANFAGDGTTSGFIPPGSDLYSMTDGVNDVPYSISYWIRLNNKDNDANEVNPISKDGAAGREWEMVNTAASSIFKIYSANGTSYIWANTGNYLNSVSTWYYVVITYDGSKLPSGISIYTNSVLNVAGSGMSGTYLGTVNRAVNLYVGRDATNANAFYKVKGQMDEVTLWKNRVLTEAEIIYLYNAGTGRRFPF